MEMGPKTIQLPCHQIIASQQEQVRGHVLVHTINPTWQKDSKESRLSLFFLSLNFQTAADAISLFPIKTLPNSATHINGYFLFPSLFATWLYIIRFFFGGNGLTAHHPQPPLEATGMTDILFDGWCSGSRTTQLLQRRHWVKEGIHIVGGKKEEQRANKEPKLVIIKRNNIDTTHFLSRK